LNTEYLAQNAVEMEKSDLLKKKQAKKRGNDLTV